MKKTVLITVLTSFILAGCMHSPGDEDFAFRQLGLKGISMKVNAVETGDIYGSGKDELILGSDTTLFIYRLVNDSAELVFSAGFPEKVLELKTGDADNDGKTELVVLTGYPGYKDGSIDLYIVEYRKKQWLISPVYSKATPRPQPVYLDIADAGNDGGMEIIASYFESKYMVETVVVIRTAGKWVSELSAPERMATARDVGFVSGLERIVQVVGRAYGDSLGEDGDAYVLDQGERMNLYSYRGVRSAIITGDADNDGRSEIYLGDGWHSNYGKMARGRLASVSFSDGEFRYSLIEDIPGQYTVNQILAEDINGDGKNELLVCGNRNFRIYSHDGTQWKVFTDTSFHFGRFTIGNLNGDSYPDAVFLPWNPRTMEGIQILNFSRLPYQENLGKEVLTKYTPPDSLLGKPAPELRVSGWYGDNFEGIGNSKGKVILLDFWATWCTPCKKTFPALRTLQDKYRDEGLIIVGLTKIDDNQSLQTIDRFVQIENFNYPIGVSEETFNDLAYGVGAIPHAVLIDKNGMVSRYFIGNHQSGELENEIRKLLKE